MFRMLDDTVPIEVLQGRDPDLALARHFGLRPHGWAKALYPLEPRNGLDRIGGVLAERLASREDLRFVKLGVVWTSEERPDRVAAFRERTGLDAGAILRRPVVADGAQPEDWAALFAFALDFGWEAAALSRRAGALLLFSHDEHLRATPPSLVRGLERSKAPHHLIERTAPEPLRRAA